MTRHKCQEAGRIMRRDAGRIRFQEADERIGIFDGAAWIVGQITRQCLTLTLMLLDFFHLSEHVNQGKRATFGDDSDEGKQWAGEVLHTVKHRQLSGLGQDTLKGTRTGGSTAKRTCPNACASRS